MVVVEEMMVLARIVVVDWGNSDGRTDDRVERVAASSGFGWLHRSAAVREKNV